MMVQMMLFSIFIILTAGCVDEQSSSDVVSDTGGGMIIAVSVLPQAEFVEKIAGDNVKVVVMVPPGADPHSYEPTPGQLRDLSKAKMYTMVGSGITIEDNLMGKIADLNPDLMIIDCSEGITLREMEAHAHDDGGEHDAEEGTDGDHEEEGGLDPHIWTSPGNVRIMLDKYLRRPCGD